MAVEVEEEIKFIVLRILKLSRCKVREFFYVYIIIIIIMYTISSNSYLCNNMLIRLKKRIIKENLLKNVLILLVGFLSYNFIYNSLSQLKNNQINDFLLVLSILLVTVSFANFAFTYEFSDLQNIFQRMLSHTATTLFLLLTFLLLLSLVISIKIIYPALFLMISLFSIILYFSIVIYDFWDLFRHLYK